MQRQAALFIPYYFHFKAISNAAIKRLGQGTVKGRGDLVKQIAPPGIFYAL